MKNDPQGATEAVREALAIVPTYAPAMEVMDTL